MKPIHTYERDERAAKVYRNSKGFYVELWESGKLLEIRDCSEHSESWAENVAENYVDKMYDAKPQVTPTPPRTLKNDVEITVKLQFKNQYSGDGETEPTREQVRKALIHHAENNLWYEETRTPVKEERGLSNDAWNVHNDLVSGKYNKTESKPEKNAYLLHEEPISNSLETFDDIDEAIETAKQMQKDLGRASKEQGGNRESKSYNTERDPFNE